PRPIRVLEERDARGPVRIVLDRLDHGTDADLVPPEVDDPVEALVPAAPVSCGHAAAVVAAAGLVQGLRERRLGSRLRDLAEVEPGAEATPGRGGTELDDWHDLGSLEEVDAAALGERDVGLLPVRAPAHVPADPTDLAELAEGADLRHLHLEERLDRLPDLDLVGAWVHPEDDLVTQLVHQRALLGDHRAEDDVGGVHASPPVSAPASGSALSCAPLPALRPRRATTRCMAARVRTRFACPSTSYTLRPSASRTLTRGRLRAARCTASSRAPSTTSTLPSSPRPWRHSSMRFVLASGRAISSTTSSLPS